MAKIISDIRRMVRFWWLFLITGNLLILSGILVLMHSIASYGQLSLFFQAAFAVNGLIEIYFVLFNRRWLDGWEWHLAGGIIDLCAAGLLVNPILAVISLPVFAGAWLLFRSIAIVARSLYLPPTTWGERGWMLLLGLAGLVFSALIIYNSTRDFLALVAWTGLALLAIGLFYVSLSLYLKDAYDHRSKNASHSPELP